MPPEIALNRWLTCGCIVSATRNITVRCRWRSPRCLSALMSGFPVIFTLPFVRSSRVILCALVLSIPASGDWGLCCALWRWWCPPPPPPSNPSVRPLLLSGLNPETPAEPLHRVQLRESITTSVSAWIFIPHPPTLTPDHPLPLCPGWISTGSDSHTHRQTQTHFPCCCIPPTTCVKKL